MAWGGEASNAGQKRGIAGHLAPNTANELSTHLSNQIDNFTDNSPRRSGGAGTKTVQ
jgi:hypothetical protein